MLFPTTTAELLIASRLLVTGKNKPVTDTITSDRRINNRHWYFVPATGIINDRHKYFYRRLNERWNFLATDNYQCMSHVLRTFVTGPVDG
jgi:hypothetical protein